MILVHRAEIDALLTQALSQHFFNSPLSAAIHYALVPAGKLLRPLLAATLARDLGWRGDLSWTIALEFLHVASLIHDDLPALDNDDVRRGRASLHRKFGEASAILAADALTAAAFGCVLGDDHAGADRVRVLAAAFVALCDGQQLDLSSEASKLAEIFRLKTGALFGACLETAYLTANNKAADRLAFKSAGEALGVAFQEIDDLHDSTTALKSPHLVSVERAKEQFRSLPGVGQASVSIVEQCLEIRSA